MKPPVLDPERRLRALRGIAANPAAPDDVLLRLVALRSTGWILAKRGPLSEALVSALFEHGEPSELSALGYNAALPLGWREALARHAEPHVRSSAIGAVTASTANGAAASTAGAHEAAGDEDKDEAARIAALYERLAADPVASVRASAGRARGAPDAVRERLASDPDPAVRCAVAEWWPESPEPVYHALLTDPEPSVRTAAVARWGRALPDDPALHAALLADPATRAVVADRVELDAARAKELADDPEELVRRGLAANPALPDAARTRLLADQSIVVLVALFARPELSDAERAALYARLGGDAAGEFDLALIDDGPVGGLFAGIGRMLLAMSWASADFAWLRSAPLDLALRHASSPYPEFRRAVATRADLPAEVSAALLRDPDPQVRRNAAIANPATPEAVVERILVEVGDNAKVRPRLTSHPSLSAAAFERFAASDDIRLQRLALRGPQLSAFTAARLARSPDVSLRRIAAAHPRLPESAVPALLQDADPDVIEAVGKAPAFPADWMRALLDDAGL